LINCLYFHNFTDSLPAVLQISTTRPVKPKRKKIYKNIMKVYNIALLQTEQMPILEKLSVLQKLNAELSKAIDNADRIFRGLQNDGIHPGPANIGSLRISFKCDSREALSLFWRKYLTGELRNTLQTGLISEYVLKKCNVTSIHLKVFISEEDYEECLERIGKLAIYFIEIMKIY